MISSPYSVVAAKANLGASSGASRVHAGRTFLSMAMHMLLWFCLCDIFLLRHAIRLLSSALLQGSSLVHRCFFWGGESSSEPELFPASCTSDSGSGEDSSDDMY